MIIRKSIIYILIATIVIIATITVAILTNPKSWIVIEPITMLIAIIFTFLSNFIADKTFLKYFKAKSENIDRIHFSVKFDEHLQALKKSSLEIDKTFEEIAKLSQKKENTMKEIEEKLGVLTRKEEELNSKIQTLEKVPLDAIKHFEDALKKGDKRNAYRDYFLFILGILFSVILSIVLKQLNV